MPSPTKRSRVLLCWGYYRKGWIAPFEELNGELDFHYLFHLTKDEEERSYTQQPRHYWNDFRSAQEVLDEIEPDSVVFMSLSGLRVIALNMVARRRGIPTFVFQHGYFRSLADYLSLPSGPPARVHGTKSVKSGSSALQAIAFMLRSNGARQPLETARAISMVLMAREAGYYRSQLRFRFRGRMPDRYITYSQETSEIHRQLDGAKVSSITPIGIPEFDPIFRLLASSNAERARTVLLIDSPNAENRYGVTTTTPKKKATFLEELAARLAERGCRLVVKLHPETFAATWLPAADNLEYVRDEAVGPLIQQARACLGFDSTLTIPAVIARPTMLFAEVESGLTKKARELGVATVVKGVDYSDAQLDAVLDAKERSPVLLERFTTSFAHSADGNATQRLAAELKKAMSQV